MNEKRYYWLKLKEDFFSSKRIKKIRSIAGGDTYTIIYLKMLLKALKNDGYLYFDGVMNDFAEEIALDIDEKPDDVKVTIQLLSSVGLMEHSEETDVYKLTYMDMMIGSETASTQRVRDFRQRQKINKALQCNTDVTEVKHLGNAEKEIEIELEIEKELETDIEIESEEETSVADVLEQYSLLCPSFPKVKKLTDKRKRQVRALLKTFSLEEIKEGFRKAEESSFLKGDNDRKWKADFDFLTNQNNLTKVLEGKYEARKSKEQSIAERWANVE